MLCLYALAMLSYRSHLLLQGFVDIYTLQCGLSILSERTASFERHNLMHLCVLAATLGISRGLLAISLKIGK